MICVEGRKKAGWLAVSAFQNVLKFFFFKFFLVLESVNNNSDQMPQRWSLQGGKSSSGSIIRNCEFCCTVPVSGISRMQKSAATMASWNDETHFFWKFQHECVTGLLQQTFPPFIYTVRNLFEMLQWTSSTDALQHSKERESPFVYTNATKYAQPSDSYLLDAALCRKVFAYNCKTVPYILIYFSCSRDVSAEDDTTNARQRRPFCKSDL